MTLMRGATLVRRGIKEYLEVAMPRQRDIALAQWELVGQQLPEIETYLEYEPTGMPANHGPIIGVSCNRTSNFSRTDYISTGEEEYRATYYVRVFLWVTTPDDEDDQVAPDQIVLSDARERTLRARDDLAGVLRSALLDRLSLGQPDAFLLNERTITEDFSDGSPTASPNGRWIAAVAIGFEMQVDEYLYRPTLNDPEEPNDLQLEAELLPLQEGP